MDALLIAFIRRGTGLWIGHDGCPGRRMLPEHERSYGLGMAARLSHFLKMNGILIVGMDALVIALSKT